MSEYREQAIKDVANAARTTLWRVEDALFTVSLREAPGTIDYLYDLSVQQRERVFELEAAIFEPSGALETLKFVLKEGYAAEAVDCGDHCHNSCMWCAVQAAIAKLEAIQPTPAKEGK